jgi:hypothetical protein
MVRHLRRTGRLFLVAVILALAAGCGGDSRRLADGQWYGKLVGVHVAHRSLTFAPACRLESARWIGGSAGADHGQTANLGQLANVALLGHLPDFPPGWFVTVRDGVAVSVQEGSGIRSSGRRDRRTFACVWSRSTQAFVSK